VRATPNETQRTQVPTPVSSRIATWLLAQENLLKTVLFFSSKEVQQGTRV
jgi:hypothetical protein